MTVWGEASPDRHFLWKWGVENMLLTEKYCLTKYTGYGIMQTGAAPGAAEE